MPSGLVSSRASPARAPTLRMMRRGSITPVTAIPYFTSSSATLWPPTITTPASRAFSAPPRRISPEHLARQSGLRPAHDIERGLRHSAHRVNVGERVGGRDLAVGERVVDHRGEEIDRVDDRRSRRVRRYTPASSPVVIPTSRSGWLPGSNRLSAAARSSGPSLPAQPAALQRAVRRISSPRVALLSPLFRHRRLFWRKLGQPRHHAVTGARAGGGRRRPAWSRPSGRNSRAARSRTCARRRAGRERPRRLSRRRSSDGRAGAGARLPSPRG